MSPPPERARPSARERQEVAVQVMTHHSAQIMATARRYAMTPEDAEDAYQRGIEILLAKVPTTNLAEVIPWLRTVIKHEAFALRRNQLRAEPVGEAVEILDAGGGAPSAEDQATVLEALGTAAEILRELKPQEARALRLRAEGLSYNEICAETEWTYTKVNRCLTEGRASFRRRFEAIERDGT